MNISVPASPSLEVRLIETAKKGVAKQAEDEIEQRAARLAWKEDVAQTICYLREVEDKEAVPVMQAIAKAEKVSGYRLVVEIDKNLVLSSRGFRIANRYASRPDVGLLDFTTYRLKRSSMELGTKLVAEGKAIQDRVRASLNLPNIEKRLC